MRGRTCAARLDPSSGGAWQTKGPGATQSRVIRARNESVLAIWQVPDAHPLPSRRGNVLRQPKPHSEPVDDQDHDCSN
jgi:hypothetical protein